MDVVLAWTGTLALVPWSGGGRADKFVVAAAVIGAGARAGACKRIAVLTIPALLVARGGATKLHDMYATKSHRERDDQALGVVVADRK